MPNVSCTFFKIHCVFYERVQTDIEDIPSEAYKVTFSKINSQTKTNQSANRCIDALWIILHHLVLTQIVQYMLRFASQMTSSIKYS